MKKCNTCGETKPLTEFYKRKASKDGRRGECKQCCCIQKQEYYIKNTEVIKERRRNYVENNKELLKNVDKTYYESHKERILQKKHEYYIENKEHKQEYDRNYREENSDTIKLKNKKWREENREEYNKKCLEYIQHRKKVDVNYRLRGLCRDRIRKAIHRQYGEKSIGTMELLGCTIQEARDHLESQFQPGMSWDNHGDWHIDHILPCASFDLTDIDEQKKCFHYTNLQPLWAEDNLKKSDKIL